MDTQNAGKCWKVFTTSERFRKFSEYFRNGRGRPLPVRNARMFFIAYVRIAGWAKKHLMTLGQKTWRHVCITWRHARTNIFQCKLEHLKKLKFFFQFFKMFNFALKDFLAVLKNPAQASGRPLAGHWPASGRPLTGQWPAGRTSVAGQWNSSGRPLASQYFEIRWSKLCRNRPFYFLVRLWTM